MTTHTQQQPKTQNLLRIMNPTLTGIVVTLIIIILTYMCVKEFRDKREGKSLMRKLDIQQCRRVLVELQERLGLALAQDQVGQEDTRWSMAKLDVSTLTDDQCTYYIQRIHAELSDPSKHPEARKVKQNLAALEAIQRNKETKAKIQDLSRPRNTPRTIAPLKNFK